MRTSLIERIKRLEAQRTADGERVVVIVNIGGECVMAIMGGTDTMHREQGETEEQFVARIDARCEKLRTTPMTMELPE